eukprot:1037873-Prorocentrum_minimum.AAC.2
MTTNACRVRRRTRVPSEALASALLSFRESNDPNGDSAQACIDPKVGILRASIRQSTFCAHRSDSRHFARIDPTVDILRASIRQSAFCAHRSDSQ